jgi:hypothetical protein
MRPAAVLLVLALAAAACTPPGEPIAHPARGDYADLMRRETDKTESSLATMQQLAGLMASGKLTRNYAVVMSRQLTSDLTAIQRDLAQIHAPSGRAQRAQNALARLVSAQAAVAGRLPSEWGQPAALHVTARAVTRASTREQALVRRIP